MSEDKSIDRDSYAAMLAAVQAYHDKFNFREEGGEDLVYRVALMSEELGEISTAVLRVGRKRNSLRNVPTSLSCYWGRQSPLTSI